MRAPPPGPWRRMLPSTLYVVALPLIALLVGLPIHLTIVRGNYEWFGLLRILRDVAYRTGFWALCAVVFGFGLLCAPKGHSILTRSRRDIGVWLATGGASMLLLRCIPGVLRSGSIFDEVALALLTPGIIIHMWATPGSRADRTKRAGRTLLVALSTFVGCTLVVFGHTMFKGMLFLISRPVDPLLLRLDTAILGAHFYEHLMQWRSVRHPELTRWLDIVYVGLFEEQWWTFLFFFGSRDYRSGRRYIVALFTCYVVGSVCYYLAPSLGPVFYQPELFTDCPRIAPDSTYLAHFLAEQTRLTQSGIAHDMAPFCFIAAFPSLHMSAALILVLAMRRSLPMTILNAVGLVFTLVATVVLGWHYFIDGIAGLALGAACWGFAVYAMKRDDIIRGFAV